MVNGCDARDVSVSEHLGDSTTLPEKISIYKVSRDAVDYLKVLVVRGIGREMICTN